MSNSLFTYSPTGVLYATREEAKGAASYEMCLQIDSYGQMSQSKPVHTHCLQPKDGWNRSNEPEEHLDQVAKELSVHLTKAKSRTLLFSYKDTTLLKRINFIKKVHADYVFNDDQKISNTAWPEDENSEEVATRIVNNQGKYDLIICRHYLEHYDYPLVIIKAMIEKLSENGSIYIEVPDCSVFVKRQNPLFLWEQHKQYFTESSLVTLMNLAGLNSSIKVYGHSIEPSICCIMNKDRSFVEIADKQRAYTHDIGKDLVNKYVNHWKKYFEESTSRKILLGIGHNSDRFMQITQSGNNIDSLIDFDPRKAGLYVRNSERPIISSIEAQASEELEIILGVHDRSFGHVRTMLLQHYPNAKIKSIFKMYES